MLKDALAAYLDERGGGEGVFATEIEALSIMRTTAATLPTHRVYRSALCLVVQGAKRVMLGDDAFDYDENSALVVSLDMPLVGHVTRAPFLGLILELDGAVLREVRSELSSPPRPTGNAPLGLLVQPVDGPLADGVERLVQTLGDGHSDARRVLVPGILREIMFWLLTGPRGGDICGVALPSGHTEGIARAIHLLRTRFARPVRVEDLASTAGMSVSSFHAHFKSLTGMTPLQFQKSLRLLEARRLLTDGATVGSAAGAVGYESDSQFSREYARLFGAPPRRDAVRLRAEVDGSVAGRLVGGG